MSHAFPGLHPSIVFRTSCGRKHVAALDDHVGRAEFDVLSPLGSRLERKAMSHRLLVASPFTLGPAASYGRISSGTSARRATSLASSTRRPAAARWPILLREHRCVRSLSRGAQLPVGASRADILGTTSAVTPRVENEGE